MTNLLVIEPAGSTWQVGKTHAKIFNLFQFASQRNAPCSKNLSNFHHQDVQQRGLQNVSAFLGVSFSPYPVQKSKTPKSCFGIRKPNVQ